MHQVFNGSVDLGQFNSTCITFISNNDNPLLHFDWRPIGHCNAIYKTVAKLICNCLKTIMPHILEMNQGAFTKGRGLVDNAYFVLEILQ